MDSMILYVEHKHTHTHLLQIKRRYPVKPLITSVMSAALALGMQSCFNYKTYQDSFVSRVQSTELQRLKEAGYPIWVFGKRRSVASLLGFWAFGDWPPPGNCTLKGALEWKVSSQPSPYIYP